MSDLLRSEGVGVNLLGLVGLVQPDVEREAQVERGSNLEQYLQG